MNKLKYTLIFVTSALILGACTQQSPPETTTSSSTPPTETISESNPSSYSLTEVALHNTPTDCWMAIDGKVYDVSNYALKHPGGDTVYQGCGQDATKLFNTRPMGSKTPHSNTARSFLPNFYIGELAE
jgi:cytochrome b involved in lipid metabolism